MKIPAFLERMFARKGSSFAEDDFMDEPIPLEEEEDKKKILFSMGKLKNLFHKETEAEWLGIEDELPDAPKKGMNKELQKKIAIALAGSAVVCCATFVGVRAYHSHQMANLVPHANPASAVQDGHKSQKQKSAEEAEDLAALLKLNPFVPASGQQTDGEQNPANAVVAGRLPSIPSMPRGQHNANVPMISGNRSLPAIPQTPTPSLPSIPQRPASAPAASPQSSGSLAGIVTDENGNSMAIMGDGTTLSQGETYGDGRVAYIGGDNIQFDNGKTLSIPK